MALMAWLQLVPSHPPPNNSGGSAIFQIPDFENIENANIAIWKGKSEFLFNVQRKTARKLLPSRGEITHWENIRMEFYLRKNIYKDCTCNV